MPRAELGIQGLKAGAATGLEKSEKRGVQAARNGPSEDRKCWQRVALGIHGLRSWGRNWSRKVRETRSSRGPRGRVAPGEQSPGATRPLGLPRWQGNSLALGSPLRSGESAWPKSLPPHAPSTQIHNKLAVVSPEYPLRNPVTCLVHAIETVGVKCDSR